MSGHHHDSPEFLAELEIVQAERRARDNETDVDEPGFAAAKAEWDEFEQRCPNPRPYTRLLWNQLTFGDRERYGRLELVSMGVKIEATGRKLVIELPDVFGELTANEVKWLTGAIEAHVSKTLHRIRDGRQYGIADRPPKQNGLSGLF